MTLRRSRFLSVLLALAVAGCGPSEDPTTPESPAIEPQPAPAGAEPDLTAEVAVAAAQVAYAAGDYMQAADLFERALSAEPASSAALSGRAWSLLMVARERFAAGEAVSAEASKAMELAFEAISKEDLGDAAWKVRLGRGLLHLLLGDHAARESRTEAAKSEYSLAEKDLSEVQRSRSGWNNLQALEGLARVARFRDDHESVVAYWGKYLEQIGKSAQLWRDALERFPRDLELWTGKLSGALLRCPPALFLRSESLMALGRDEEAATEASKLIELGRELEILEHLADAMDVYASFLLCAKRLGLPEHHEGVKQARARVRALGR